MTDVKDVPLGMQDGGDSTSPTVAVPEKAIEEHRKAKK